MVVPKIVGTTTLNGWHTHSDVTIGSLRRRVRLDFSFSGCPWTGGFGYDGTMELVGWSPANNGKVSDWSVLVLTHQLAVLCMAN